MSVVSWSIFILVPVFLAIGIAFLVTVAGIVRILVQKAQGVCSPNRAVPCHSGSRGRTWLTMALFLLALSAASMFIAIGSSPRRAVVDADQSPHSVKILTYRPVALPGLLVLLGSGLVLWIAYRTLTGRGQAIRPAETIPTNSDPVKPAEAKRPMGGRPYGTYAPNTPTYQTGTFSSCWLPGVTRVFSVVVLFTAAFLLARLSSVWTDSRETLTVDRYGMVMPNQEMRLQGEIPVVNVPRPGTSKQRLSKPDRAPQPPTVPTQAPSHVEPKGVADSASTGFFEGHRPSTDAPPSHVSAPAILEKESERSSAIRSDSAPWIHSSNNQTEFHRDGSMKRGYGSTVVIVKCAADEVRNGVPPDSVREELAAAILTLGEDLYDVRFDNWSPPTRWFTERWQPGSEGVSRDLKVASYRITVSDLDLRKVVDEYLGIAGMMRGLGIARAYLGTVLILGGLAFLSRVGMAWKQRRTERPPVDRLPA